MTFEAYKEALLAILVHFITYFQISVSFEKNDICVQVLSHPVKILFCVINFLLNIIPEKMSTFSYPFAFSCFFSSSTWKNEHSNTKLSAFLHSICATKCQCCSMSNPRLRNFISRRSLYTLGIVFGMWSWALPKNICLPACLPRILWFYLISDNTVVVQKAHHKHTQHGNASALALNSASLTLSPSNSLSLFFPFSWWKTEIIIPAVKCNSLSHKTAVEI